MTDDDLSQFLGDTRRHLDRELAAVAPDFAASVARAREIDPQAVSARAVEETAALAPVAQLRRRQAESGPHTDLAPFVTDLRDQLDADLARRIHHGAIASATGRAPVVALRSRRPLVLTALALAAAVVLAFGLRGALEARDARPGVIPGAAALAGSRSADARAEHRAPTHQATEREPGPPVPEDRFDEPVPEDSSPVPEDMLAAPVPEDSPAPTGRPRPRKPPREPAGPAPIDPSGAAPTEDPLAALDREAQALWQAGDLRGAADKFAEIVRRAPSSRAAETAYGDLFALEHRLGGDLVDLWRAYLRQFPRGRYADDARAGICRREPPAERPTCWRAYLEDRPDGAHRREAEQAAAP